MRRLPMSVVIPTYQRRASVERLLRALGGQTLPGADFEVILSIDGSDDGTSEAVSALRPTYTLHHQWQRNSGRAAACNAGIRRASGEVVLLLDDDMEPSPGCLSAHRDRHAADGRLGVLGAVPIALPPDASPAARYVAEKFGAHLERLRRPGTVIGVRDFYSGHFSIRRDLLLALGLFDEDFRVYGNEDVELAVRLLAAGVRLVYSAEALAWQHYEKDFRALARDSFAKGRTAVLCAAKHPESIPAFRLGTYAEASPRWRIARALLLALTWAWSEMPEVLIRLWLWLEGRWPQAMKHCYGAALDYFFWAGVRTAPNVTVLDDRHSVKNRGP
jgi:GT2 family glycosyltransferase